MPFSAVADASVLIGLDDIDLLDRLEPLFDHLVLPLAVAQEVVPTVALPAWCERRTLTAEIPDSVRRVGLGPGETEAIALAIELEGYRLLLDERRARNIAISLGIPVIGTAGLLVQAKREGLVPTIRPHLEMLIATHFFISDQVFALALRQANEE